MPITKRATLARPGWLLPVLFPLLGWGQEVDVREGTSLVDAITALRAQGLQVAYSNDQITPSMRVLETASPGEPIEVLREILAPHGLTVSAGPGGRWIVVRQTEPAPRETDSARANALPIAERPPLELVVVTASRYALGRDPTGSTRYLNRAEIAEIPTLGSDALRVTHTLPGFASNGLSARFNVRGGEANEALMLLDGLRLYNPFHLKDFQSLFSSINPRMLEGMAVATGGYPVRFGDRMSGVVEMDSLVPGEDRYHELGLSTFESSFLSSGRFSGSTGDWVASIRRGNLDLLADAAKSNIGQPRYLDVFGKITMPLGSDWKVSAYGLRLQDEISLNDSDLAAAVADYDDTYVWLRFERASNGPFSERYLVSHTRLSNDRSGMIEDPDLSTGRLSDRRRIDVSALQADWSYELSERHLVSWGVGLNDSQASYDFDSIAVFPEPIRIDETLQTQLANDVEAHLSGGQQLVYGSYRARVGSRITGELGLRWDRQTYVDDHQLSPRINVLVDVSPAATLRIAWGRFFQSQGLDELQANDGIANLWPAQEAEHSIVSLQYEINPNLTVRVEAYRKEFESLRPRFENLFSRVSLLPELLPDRVRIDATRGESTGLEFMLEGSWNAWTWWLNIDRSSVEDAVDAREIRRSWDQAWSIKAGGAWSNDRWSLSVTGSAHSGWPTTTLSLDDGELVAGDFNATTLDRFSSLDARITRHFNVARGELSVFGQLTNALGRDNECCLDYRIIDDTETGTRVLETELDGWLPLVPSFGVLWQF